jgi:2-C-methyl-D-erythritol 4-phosphate cytidylyltransferase
MQRLPACWALVPAAGVGRRLRAGTPKQFLSIGGYSVLDHTLHALSGCPSVTGLVVVGDVAMLPQDLDNRFEGKRCLTAPGGDERCHSVLNGLSRLAESASEDTWVLVHDAARPCVRSVDIEKLLAQVIGHHVGGLLGIPVSDTMKQIDNNQLVVSTIDRRRLWRAQTPQLFRLGQLKTALEDALRAGVDVTDEASAMEHAGLRPKLVEGHSDNIKITGPGDLELAEFYLKQQGRL